ncbi:acetyltransferase (GNAT) family protein [mine drainage metagenome]|uniref:Acetyltransferase (GNAT) family protein n=1 Tax=mine drainage metagenome TaxID=410659 RepID=A0A1J5QDM3_9ZZZZ
MIRTNRLLLRQWGLDEIDTTAALDLYSQEKVLRWLGAAPQPGADEAAAKEWIKGWATLHDGVRGLWAVVQLHADGTASGPPVGTALLAKLPRSDGEPSDASQIGWHFHPDVWGRGYATEATLAIIERARAGGLPEVHALVYPENFPSLALCDRIGMDRRGLTNEWDGVTAIDHVLAL